jgi:hypothetical protein
MTDQEILDANILVELGLEHLPEDQKTQIINTIATLVQKSAMLRILNQLNEDQVRQLEALIQEKGAEHNDVIAFLHAHVSTIAEILQEELLAVKRDLIMQAKNLPVE